MTKTLAQEYRQILDDGRGCEAAYFAAYEGGETPMGADTESAIGRAALGGLRDRVAGNPYGFRYSDYA